MKEERISEALSFDDILLEPAYSNVLPRDTDVSTKLAGNIKLNIPILSAAMDTVTESRLAIAIAREGGIGIIHKNLTIEEQASEVDQVKRSQSGVITHPFTLSPNNTLADAEELMSRYRISGVPITDEHEVLVGILTNRDLRFEENFSRKISEIMTPKERIVTVPPGTTLDEAKQILHKHRIEKLPIVDKQGRLKGLLTVKDIIKARDFPNRCVDEMGRLRVGAAIGIGEDELTRIDALVESCVDVLVIDSAHGHSRLVIEMVSLVKKRYPQIPVIAGNVVTAEGAKALIDAGVDAVKVGVGPGAICTTRVVTGVGVPQITAVLNTVCVCKDKNIPVISDGGIKYSGDIAKAIAAGADSVMIGSLFAGTEESPGERVLYEGRTYKLVRGMGSIKAMQKGSKTRYMHFDTETTKLVPEGIEGRVPYRGALGDVIHQLVGGLRAAMGYCGCLNIKSLQENTKLIRITSAGIKESHPHDITITEDAPNYQIPR
ncbi:MAG TPA: IMP dehydrogenase [Candidatus Hydrogenedens sp.]|nr:IMP dehydrogenase [Candidatus Hydrogenedens sp.]